MKKGMNRKGLSDVVTTVLIILFAIVAVAVVGGIVMNQITKAGKNIDKASFCTENVVEPVSCIKDISNNVRVGYTRTNGEATMFTTTHVRANIEMSDATIIGDNVGTASILKGISATYTKASVTGTPKAVELATTYFYKGGAGEQVVCTSRKLDCTLQ